MFIRQTSGVNSKASRSERETIKCLLIVKLFNQHRALIKTLLDYKRQQSGVLSLHEPLVQPNPGCNALLSNLSFLSLHLLPYESNGIPRCLYLCNIC